MVRDILLIGAGRMGQRHLSGLKNFRYTVTVVDISSHQLRAITKLAEKNEFKCKIKCYTSTSDIPSGATFDAAIVAATADCRPQNVAWAIGRGIKHILLEKPVAQSRSSLNKIAKLADKNGTDICCNFYRRNLPYYQAIRARLIRSVPHSPMTMVVTSGAMGLGCNGIHYIDFALFLTGAQSATLTYGDVQNMPIRSGRGPQFVDYGGTGIFDLPDGSRLILNVMANSSAPTSILFYESRNLLIVDQNKDLAIEYSRDPKSRKPNYLYGLNYARGEMIGIEAADLAVNTRKWLAYLDGSRKCPLPKLREVMLSHSLLFDLLETSGRKRFHFT